MSGMAFADLEIGLWYSWNPRNCHRYLNRCSGKWSSSTLSPPMFALGTFVAADSQFLELHDADLHDFRDNPATREVYVHDSVRLGIKRNRARVLVRRAEIVAVTEFNDIATF